MPRRPAGPLAGYSVAPPDSSRDGAGAQVAGVLGAAEALERGIHHLPALGGEPVGVVLDTQAPTSAAIALQHGAQILARGRALAVTPDADVPDDGRDARLPQVGRAGAERELAVGAQVHALEHAVRRSCRSR